MTEYVAGSGSAGDRADRHHVARDPQHVPEPPAAPGHALQEPHAARALIGPDRLGSITLDDRRPARGDLGQRLVPRDPGEAAFALGADASLGIEEPVGRARVVEEALDLGAQRAARVGMRAVAAQRRCRAVLHRDDPATGVRTIERAGAVNVAGDTHVSTIWVWMVIDSRRPDSSVTRVCQTIVRRPRWSGVDSARTVPDRPAAKKLVLDSSVVVPEPGGRFSAVANAPTVSASAIRVPPCRLPPNVVKASRYGSSATTRSRLASVNRRPSSSGSVALQSSFMAARSMSIRASYAALPVLVVPCYDPRMTTDLLETVEIETAPAPRAAIIWLHGLGADGHDFEPIVPELGLPKTLAVRFVFPHAPSRPVTINGGTVMRAWYDVVAAGGDRREVEPGVRDSARRIEALIDRERARGVADRAIVLAGFSQGGAMALHTGLRHPEPLAGIMALSCFLPLADTVATEASDANRDVPIF